MREMLLLTLGIAAAQVLCPLGTEAGSAGAVSMVVEPEFGSVIYIHIS